MSKIFDPNEKDLDTFEGIDESEIDFDNVETDSSDSDSDFDEIFNEDDGDSDGEEEVVWADGEDFEAIDDEQ